MELIFKRIEFGSPDYDLELDLRYRVLRKPLGYPALEDLSPTEETDLHFGAFDDGKLVACLLYVNLGGGVAKMRQVAVEPEQQGRGIGSRLVSRSERLAAENGFHTIVLNARKTAVPFYLSLGYIIEGEEFAEVGIPHLAMKKEKI